MKKSKNEDTVARIKGKLEEAAPEIVDNMLETLRSSGTPAAVKVRIYEIILDRLMGKPEATIRLEDASESMEEAEKVVAAIAEGIRKNAKGEA